MTDSPRAYWRLGETSGTVAADESAGNVTGTYQLGVTLGVGSAIPTDTNPAARFDGVDDRVNMGDPGTGTLDFGTGDFSVEAWIKTTSNGNELIASKQGAAGPYWNVIVTRDGGKIGRIRASINDGSVTREAYGPAVRVDNGKWHHVVVVFARVSGTTVYVDRNNVRQTAGAASGDVSNASAYLVGGKAGTYPSFKGDIDEVAVYGAALSATRVQAHYDRATIPPDITPPSVSLTTPANGSSTADSTPTFAGSAGLAAGDLATVSLKVYAGSSVAGTLVESLITSRGGTGAWTVDATPALAEGTYTAQAEQQDQAQNVGTSAPATFNVVAAPPVAYRDVVMADGPRAYWRLGETSGTVAADETAAHSSGAYQNGVTLGTAGAVQNESNAAARLDGIDDQVSMGDPSSGGLDFGKGDFTFEGWIRTTANADQIVASKQPSGSAPYWQVTVTDDYGATGRIRARLYDGSVMRQAYGPAVHVDDGAWHHVVVLFARAVGITIYVDKSYVRQTLGAMSGDVSNSAAFLIGGETVYYYPAFRGDIDEVAVYPALLPASRVQAHYDQVMSGDTSAPAIGIAAPAQYGSVSDTTPSVSGLAGMAVGDDATVTLKLYSGSLAAGTPVAIVTTVRDNGGAWGAEPSQALTPGTYTAQAEQRDAAGNSGASTPVTFSVVAPTSSATDPVLLAAGDIADCNSSGDEATASLLDGQAGSIVTTGDNVYESGTDTEFANCYGPTWGRHKARTSPAVGDHEYVTAGAAGYYRYFGTAAGDPAKGYYSYDLGTWHIVVLNANCGEIGGCQAGSPQEQWLRADLSAHPNACTLSSFASPLFSSGSHVGDNLEVLALWQALYDYRADVVLTGDDHDYERFAPQTPAGKLDLANGIGEFVLGTGGRSHYAFPVGVPAANSQARDDATFGILKLSLHPAGYDWSFLPVAGKTFTDSGSRSCH